jgi:hypothetical protein
MDWRTCSTAAKGCCETRLYSFVNGVPAQLDVPTSAAHSSGAVAPGGAGAGAGAGAGPQLDLAKTAKLITDISAADAEVDLSGLDAVAGDAALVAAAKRTVEEQAEARARVQRAGAVSVSRECCAAGVCPRHHPHYAPPHNHGCPWSRRGRAGP